jgi:MFS family permease
MSLEATLTAPSESPSTRVAIRARTTTREAVLSVTLLLTLGVLCMIDAQIVSSLLTPIKNDLKLADEQFARITAIGAFVALWANPVYGYLGNTFGRKKVIFGGLVLLSLCSIGSGLSTGYLALLSARVLVAFSAVSYNVLAPSWIADLYSPKWRNFVFTIYHLKNRVGVSSALILGGWLAAHYDWHIAFIATGGATLLVVFLILLVREPHPGESDGHSEKSITHPTFRQGLEVFKYKGYVYHTLAYSFFMIGMYGQSWIPAYLYRTFHITNQQASEFLGAVLLATIPLGLAGGWLTGFFSLHRHRGGYATFLGITSIGASVAFFTAYHQTDVINAKFWIATAFSIFALSVGSLTTLIVGTVPPRLRTSATSISPLVSGIIASILAAEVWGIISDHYGLGWAILLAPTGYLIAGLLWGFLAFWQRKFGP